MTSPLGARHAVLPQRAHACLVGPLWNHLPTAHRVPPLRRREYHLFCTKDSTVSVVRYSFCVAPVQN
jgi:hypothetical protein